MTVFFFLLLPLSRSFLLRRSSRFCPRMHFLSYVFSSPLVYHCFTVKLFNSFIGVSTLVTFLLERHGCVRGVVYMSNVSCNISLLFYRSFELIPVSLREADLFPLRSRVLPSPVHLFPFVGFTGVGPAES